MDNKLNIRNEDVQDILSSIPHWLIRWGNSLIFFIFILLFLSLFYIKYPDTITSKIVITTMVPPEKIISKKSGKIEHLFVKNYDAVKVNQILGIIENKANYKHVFLIKRRIDSIDLFNTNIFLDKKISNLELGEISSSYSNFEKKLLEYNFYRNQNPYNIDKNEYHKEDNEVEKKISFLKGQYDLSISELKYKKKELDRYEKLFEKGFISSQEWESKNIEYIQKEKNLNSIKTDLSVIRSSQISLLKKYQNTLLNENKDDISLHKELELSILELKRSIAEWENQYILKSNSDGKVSFLKIWTHQQDINAEDIVFVVIPEEKSNYIGKANIPVLNSGKLKIGQKAIIKLDNYPYTEFGTLEGKVISFSLIPSEEKEIFVDLQLDEELKTNANKILKFHQEMHGNVDIITDDLSIFDRVFFSFRNVLSK